MSIVMTGLWIRGEYQRLDDMAIEYQVNEKNVMEEMRNIIKTQTPCDQKDVADSLMPRGQIRH
jgi:hypothetical protein